MNVKPSLHCAAALALLACCVSQASAASLYDYFTQAQASNAGFAAAQAQARASDEAEPQSRARLLPNLSIVAGTGWVDHRDEGPVQHDRNNANAYAVVLTQPLLRWQDVISHDQGTLAGSAGQLQVQAARQALILQVAQVYFDVTLAQQDLQAAHRHRLLVASQHQHLENANHQGSATRREVDALQSQADLAEARELDAKDALTLAQEAFRQVTGQAPETLSVPADRSVLQAPVPADIDSWANSARDASLAVQAAQIKLQIAEKGVDRQEAEHLPTLDLIAAYGRFDAGGGELMGASLSSRDYDQAAVGLKMSLPLYAGGGTSSRVRQAIAQRESQGYELLDQRREAEMAARRAYVQVVGGINRFKALSNAARSAAATCAATRTAFEDGAAVSNDVLLAQDRLDDIAMRLAQSRHDVALGQLRLLAATAQLSPDDLKRFSDAAAPAEGNTPCR